MGQTEFGLLQGLKTGHEGEIATLRHDVAYWKGRGERAEYAREALEHHNAALKQQLAACSAPALDTASPNRVELRWSWIDEAPVVVDGAFQRRAGGDWDVSIDAVWLRGAEIGALVAARLASLRGAVETALEQQYQAAREEAVL